jgi:hypothetical protein
MATVTLATNAVLAAVPYTYGMPAADAATMRSSIKNDKYPLQPVFGRFERNGLLYIPHRGVLQMLPGDYIGIDSTGWPILVSALSAGTAAAWTHT